MNQERDYDPSQVERETRELAASWDAVQSEAEMELRHFGFGQLPQPQFTCPPLDPKTLSSMDLINYGETHMRYVAWLNYSENILSYVKSNLLGIKRQMDELHNKLRLTFRQTRNPETGKPFSVDDAKALAEQNPRYLELLRELTKMEQMKLTVEAHVESYSKICSVISRHIELRKLEVERMGTGHNLPGRGVYGTQR